jgi:hypothetical protein
MLQELYNPIDGAGRLILRDPLSTLGNTDPILDSAFPVFSIEEGAISSYDLDQHFFDPDPDVLLYTVTSALPSGFTLSTAGVLSWDGSQLEATSAQWTIVCDDQQGGTPAQGVLTLSVIVSNPVITDVNTTNIVQVGSTPTTTGTDFGAVEGTQTFGGVLVGVNTWGDTSILSTAIVRGDKSYASYDWVVTNDDPLVSAPLSVELAIETGFQYVELTNPITALVGGYVTSLCYNTSPLCATGDQLRVPLLTNQGKSIDISAADGTFVIVGAGDTEQTFSFEIWDATGPVGEKWSASTAAVINGFVVLPPAAGASNEDMIAYFRAVTGLDSFQFNDLAIAYYQQEGATDMASFNDALSAAQKAVPFVGLAPSDWRNYL